MWWIALAGVVSLFIGLIVGFWSGHFLGHEQLRSELLMHHRIEAVRFGQRYRKFAPKDAVIEDVFWCYRELLQREPSNDEVAYWAGKMLPLSTIAEAFIKTPEFAELSVDRQKASRSRLKERLSIATALNTKSWSEQAGA